MRRYLVTGGAGFIGSNFIRYQRQHHPEDSIVVLDLLTYAGNIENLDGLQYGFIRKDIVDVTAEDLAGVDAVVHMAAESHVDRSIQSAADFVRTNVQGTQALLDAARAANVKTFLYMSTDEVMGDLGPDDPPFNEWSPMHPNSPYAASKAAGEMLTLAAYRTHGFPVVVVRPSNNYGPRQHPEKLIPNLILKALACEPLPVYGDGQNVRDWLHVGDCCAAIDRVLRDGIAGEVYCLGGRSERRNIDVARAILAQVPESRSEIQFVKDRLGHDRRYAVDGWKTERDLKWSLTREFEDGLAETVAWYRDHVGWFA